MTTHLLSFSHIMISHTCSAVCPVVNTAVSGSRRTLPLLQVHTAVVLNYLGHRTCHISLSMLLFFLLLLSRIIAWNEVMEGVKATEAYWTYQSDSGWKVCCFIVNASLVSLRKSCHTSADMVPSDSSVDKERFIILLLSFPLISIFSCRDSDHQNCKASSINWS